MISAAEFAAYNREVARIGDGAAGDVEAAVLSWCRAHGDATVAEKREAAKLIMEGFVQGYDDVAAEFAAQWYDDLAERNGARLQQAVTMTTYRPESVDEVARYQAKKLAKGDDAAFARACGEYARNDAFRSLNETIVANVGRDGDRGVRFARVPTGLETCTFCIMLASRGAVYHTRKSAGEFRHFHRNCDCKVVPGFEEDPDAELVEGVRPKELRDLHARLKEIDADSSLTGAQRDAVKSLIASGHASGVEEAMARWREEALSFESRLSVVDSNEYRATVSDIFGADLAETAWKDIRHTLKVKSGQPHENLYAYDLKAGRRISAVIDSPLRLSVRVTPSMRAEVARALAAGGEVALVHNHPGSGLPSIADVVTLSGLKARLGVIACHDGSIIQFSVLDDRYTNYTDDEIKRGQEALDDFVDKRLLKGKGEPDVLAAIENEWGIKVERIRFN